MYPQMKKNEFSQGFNMYYKHSHEDHLTKICWTTYQQNPEKYKGVEFIVVHKTSPIYFREG